MAIIRTDEGFLLPVQIDRHFPLLFAEPSPPAAELAPCPGRSQPGTRPLADQVTLKFRQCPDDMKDQLATRRGRVDALLVQEQVHAIAVDVREEGNKVL